VTARSPVARRAVLAAGGLAGVLAAAGLAGCTGATPTRPTPATTPPDVALDLAATDRARASATALAVAATSLAGARPDLAGLLATVVADHRAHLAALGVAPTAAASPSASGAAAGRRPDAAGLAGTEFEAARQALTDAQATSPGLAALLARIAAARATHADLVSARASLRPPPVLVVSPTPASATPGSGASVVPTPATMPAAAGPTAAAAGSLPGSSASGAGAAPGVSATGGPGASLAPGPIPAGAALRAPARDALAALAAGEHAAVYAYGVVAARVADADRSRALAAWNWHVTRRDELEERLLDAGVQPPAAAPAYQLGAAPDAGAAVALAATVEDRLAQLAAHAVAATTGADRSDAAGALVAGARRAAAWRGRGAALPG
jgi:hypothetical protein